MRRLRDRLNNKKGFTLVELIVVIVIILILAAVLVPNVMRYIGQARQSAFQSEASTYFTELEGLAAEYYAKNDDDLTQTNFTGTSALTLTEFTYDSSTANLVIKKDGALSSSQFPVKAVNSGGKKNQAQVKQGAIIQFTYQDKDHWVSWDQTNGWYKIDDATGAY